MPVAQVRPTAPSDDKRWQIVETRMRRLGNRPDALIEALHSAQEAFGFIDDAALRYVGDVLAVPPSTVFGVATFYHHFTLKPQGEHTCVVCTGTACHINGSEQVLAAIRRVAGHPAARDDRRREAVAADRPLPGRVQPGSRRDHRRRGRGPGHGRRVRGPAGGAVTSERLQPTGTAPVRAARPATAVPRPWPRRAHAAPQVGVAPAEGPARASAYVCEAVSCLSARSHDVFDAPDRAVVDRGPRRRGGQARRLPGPVRRRTAGRASPRPAELFERVAPGRASGPSSARSHGRRPAPERGAPGAVLRPAGAHRHRELREVDPENLDDYLARGGYQALRHGADHDDAGRGPRRGRDAAACAGGAAPATRPA